MLKFSLCDSGAGVSVMHFSLYKKLDLENLVPTEVSLQMADKSTAIPIGVCENVPIPEDDNLSIILGRPFVNTAGAIIDCIKGKVTFNVKGKEHPILFPKKAPGEIIKKGINTRSVMTLTIGIIKIPIPPLEPKYKISMIGTIPLKIDQQKS
jgi:hypothetical protein